MPKWPVDCRGVYREVRPVVYNKAIFKLRATSLDKKAMRITLEIEMKHCQSSVWTDRMATPGAAARQAQRGECRGLGK